MTNNENKIRNQKTKSVGNGEGSLCFNEKQNRWEFYYYNNDNERKAIKQRKKETVKEFKARVTEIKDKLNKGTYIEKNNETFIEILESITQNKYDNGDICFSSYDREKKTINQIRKTCSNFINKPIQKVTIDDIEKAKKNIRQQYANEVISKIWGLLEITFKTAHARRKIQFNILDDITVKKPISIKPKKEIKALTIEEQEKLISIMNNEEKEHKYRDIILLQLYSGMRIGEVLGLCKDCVNLEENTITVRRGISKDENGKKTLVDHTKTYNIKTGIDKGKRTYPMTQEIRMVIERILKNKISNINGLLFWNQKNDCVIEHTTINSYLRRINKKYNICVGSLHTHRFRHSFITRNKEKGMNHNVLQKIVGHTKGSSMTDEIYTTVDLRFMENELKRIN